MGASGPSLVVGFDGSAAAGRAVADAIELAAHLQGRVFLVHARETNERRAEPVTEEEVHSVEEAIAAAVATWSTRAALRNVPLVAVQRDGRPAEAILAVAQEVHASRIVVGTRGLGPVERVVLGSVSLELIGRAKLPVTVVP